MVSNAPLESCLDGAPCQVLTDITRDYKQFAASTSKVDILTPEKPFGKGFKWRELRRVLYLREECIFTVTDCSVSKAFLLLKQLQIAIDSKDTTTDPLPTSWWLMALKRAEQFTSSASGTCRQSVDSAEIHLR